ncbi:MAG: trypsin-like peptidase domain-containing protein, partial [Planctomycetaceae bacterium]|nr:trypsin-like peptidase domain-containing protein [Planctomycetaceae bacterium]
MIAEPKNRCRSVLCTLLTACFFATIPPQILAESGTSDDDRTLQLADQIRKSLVVVRATDRTGDESGFGAGFAVDQPGLIATARHVIGDGRDFIVELPDGSAAKVIEVFASSSQLDLAIIRIDSTSLPPLALFTADVPEQLPLIALGHPLGRRNQLARGKYSGEHEIDGIRMLELAMPIEPGNSGGPVLNAEGRVIGLVTMKSSVRDRIGYALSAKLIRQLIDEPNPVPMDQWKTIGALDARAWKTVFGGEWKQRSARILVNGAGTSFGGRTLCVHQGSLPDFPFDLKVDVKMGDEQGAAGLIFHADGGDRHYGFYPSAGNLRLTRFDGPDVGSWTILHNAPHPAYRTEDWNTLLVRIHTDHFECFLNGKKVAESSDAVVPHGAIGLAAFRGTPAEFRRFQTGTDLLPAPLSDAAGKAVNDIIADISPNHPSSIEAIHQLLSHGIQTTDAIHAEADRMEKVVKQLRRMAAEVHEAAVRRQLVELLADKASSASSGDENPDHGVLLKSALLISRMDNPDVDVETYIDRVRQWVDEIRATLPVNADETTRLTAMDRYLFEKLGFHGSRFEYYTRANSYLNEVIEDREGLPITLSVLYIEIGRRLDLDIKGIGLPGHFVVQFTPSSMPTESQFIDPFERGKRLSEVDVTTRLTEARYPNLPQFRIPQTTQQICERMIGNL